ncbi:hypothetical protein SOV_11490 [Sporomusa ovata DSM 2662]|uniref:Uncharacterized protein n=1 Tax=Sporomusa ovata TaxID=2378 RepID=A0A0U1KWX8_9FIRM|nr:hypothetical protein [Sporomusa ovata]EQB28772.1 hypothetical protein SOV_1c04870 [Sporomusa ovata DSM 2662]CQR71927.1 FIG01197219: hypothetical protein [Sporomusa ovata]
MGFLIFLLIVVLGAAVGVWLYIAKQGDANFKFIVDQRTNFTLTGITKETATFSTTVPFINNGSQDGTLMDVFPRHFLPCEQFDAVDTDSRLTLDRANRNDGYWEACIIPVTTGGSIILTVKFTAKSGDIKAALKDMVDMPIDIVYQVVARSLWYIAKERLVMTADEIHKALAASEEAAAR